VRVRSHEHVVTDDQWMLGPAADQGVLHHHGAVAQALAATDPDRAERIANSVTDESSKAEALSSIAQALAATDPRRATQLFTDAERIANSITFEDLKALALSDIAQALAALSS
jgi:hypothetical protein